ncbi:MAG: UDP-2,3-diacylglucosamine diphosphatase [Deltaproteobacteria bacterium]|nr:UDP-2,3-diacylglucosamine diphosphatase [Deltaproteobacteria bacterium]
MLANGGGNVSNQNGTAAQFYRTVWLSDIHLGFRGCSATSLLAFLRSVECEYLYLVGDIIDIWSVRERPFWPQEHNNILRTILGKAKYGTKVIYVPGNHDEMLRDYNGMAFGNIRIADRIVHRKADGKRFLVIHGDQFDSVVRSSRAIALLGSHAYDLLLGINTRLNLVRRKLGLPYWSLAGAIKHKVKNAMRYISNFEAAVSFEAARLGVDGVICGHIHRPQIISLNDITYCNCGDWVESNSALVEHDDGSLELLHWQDTQRIGQGNPGTALEPVPLIAHNGGLHHRNAVLETVHTLRSDDS